MSAFPFPVVLSAEVPPATPEELDTGSNAAGSANGLDLAAAMRSQSSFARWIASVILWRGPGGGREPRVVLICFPAASWHHSCHGAAAKGASGSINALAHARSTAALASISQDESCKSLVAFCSLALLLSSRDAWMSSAPGSWFPPAKD